MQWSGGDLQGATEAIRTGYFDALGVKTIWLSPVNAQVNAAMPGRVSPRLIAPYHGYWPISGRAVDPRFGGDAALREFIETAHSRGIRVLLDLINNQVHETHEYVEAHPEWFRTDCVCGLSPGCGWSERPFECLFAPYLPDIDWTHPGAQAQFIDDAVFWVEEYGVDGFRVDAVKHVESMAVFNLRAALQARFEKEGTAFLCWGKQPCRKRIGSAVCADSNSMMGMSGLMDTSVTTLWTANSTSLVSSMGGSHRWKRPPWANRIGHGGRRTQVY